MRYGGSLSTIDKLQTAFEAYQDTFLKAMKASKKLTKFQNELLRRLLTEMNMKHNQIYRELNTKCKPAKSGEKDAND